MGSPVWRAAPLNGESWTFKHSDTAIRAQLDRENIIIYTVVSTEIYKFKLKVIMALNPNLNILFSFFTSHLNV